jgi:hypothetical protein
LLIIGGLGLLAAQLYLNRPAMTEKIHAVFSQKFGGRLTSKNLRINLLRGLTVQELRLEAAAAVFLEIRRVSVEYSPLALCRKQIKVPRLDLEQARLNFTHQNDAWLLPRPRHNFIKQALTLSTGHNTFVIRLDNINLSDTTVSLRAGADGNELFHADGINLTGRLAIQNRQGTAQGRLTARDMQFGATLTLHDIQAQVSYANDELRCTQLSGSAYGGQATGAITIPLAPAPGATKQYYGVSLHFSDIDFPALLKAFNADPTLLQTRLNFSCDLWGDLNHPSLIQGKGWFESKATRLTGVKVLDLIGNLLKQPGLRDTQFDTVHGSFKIADDQLTFYFLEIISPDLKISASGTVKYDQTIDFDVLLTVNPTLLQQLPAEVTEQFSTQPDGSKSIACKVSGTPEAPACNLADKLYGKAADSPSS